MDDMEESSCQETGIGGCLHSTGASEIMPCSTLGSAVIISRRSWELDSISIESIGPAMVTVNIWDFLNDEAKWPEE